MSFSISPFPTNTYHQVFISFYHSVLSHLISLPFGPFSNFWFSHLVFYHFVLCLLVLCHFSLGNFVQLNLNYFQLTPTQPLRSPTKPRLLLVDAHPTSKGSLTKPRPLLVELHTPFTYALHKTFRPKIGLKIQSLPIKSDFHFPSMPLKCYKFSFKNVTIYRDSSWRSVSYTDATWIHFSDMPSDGSCYW